MFVRFVMTLGAAVLLIGCSRVGVVTTDGGEAGLREVNRAIGGKVVRMELRDRRTLHVVGLHVETDSVTWVDRKTNRMQSLPTSSVFELSYHKTGAGAIRGLILGAAVGAAFGGVRASVEGDDPLSDPLAITREEKFRIFPVAHAVYASLVSTPIGAIIGTRKVFRFTNAGGMPATVSTR